MIAGRLTLQTLGGLAAALGLFAAMAGSPSRSTRPGLVDAATLASEIEREADHVTARELAAWIREGKKGLHVLDVRSDSEFTAYHIPSAERASLNEIVAREPQPGETLVLYSEGGAHAAQAWVLLRAAGHEHVYFLRGGLLDWMDDVMNPVVSGDSAADVAALSRYFGGVPRAGTESAVPLASTTGTTRATPPRENVIERVRRRGC